MAQAQGLIYAVMGNGELRWYRHLGRGDGTGNWEGPKQVGTGWQDVRYAFSGDDGLIYAVMGNGELRWYRHLGRGDGIGNWEGPKQVGTGWQDVRYAFSGG